MTVKAVMEDEGQRNRIAERAYELFLEEGCEHGNDLGHWYRAELEIIDEFEDEEPEERPEERKVGQRASRSK